ncbi:SH3 domain-containing protein [Paracoccus isoporae]|uniref:SH3 domain-containing protein n=1 Tax=Paracoccus isoporae TaxID=591205 RepID=A0A1G7E634_9RHOB|nr:SH3 domain-containing protein [Paracoccus isoporae]SDE59089.1 SH3 domain-containing protein [Paracoccus isoporae]
MFHRLAGATALTLALSGPILAQTASNPVVFPVGTTGTQLEGSISGQDVADFTLTARQGQTLIVKMVTDNPSGYFNIYGPGSVPGEDEPLHSGSSAGLDASLEMPSDGTYLIRTFQSQEGGNADGVANYTLSVSVDGDAPDAGADATVTAEGPDLWQVAGAGAGLNIRSEPTQAAEVLARVENGTSLRNRGCKPVGETSWCEVETTSGTPVSGWAANSYLRAPTEPVEADPPPASPAVSAQPPAASPARVEAGDAPPASPAIRADKPAPKPAQAEAPAEMQGELPCSVAMGAPTQNCAFTASRGADGAVTVTIDWPEGGQRELRFADGAPAPREGMTSERRGALTVINIGDERYEIPDELLNGG